MNPYDVLEYEDFAIPQTHPDRLYIEARIRGVAARDPGQCRYLELGCAHAANLIPMAHRLPGSQFVGVELSVEQARVGRDAVDDLGLPNLEVRQMDIMDIDDGFGDFDYIVAHGLFSWAPSAVREKILAICRDHLRSEGIAYVSYNTLPSWGLRGGVRQAMMELASGVDEVAERVAKARQALDLLSSVDTMAGTALGTLLEEDISQLADKSDSYIVHEYLAPENRAYFFRDFLEKIEPFALEFLCDLAESPIGQVQENHLIDRLESEVLDRHKAQQLADVILCRQFRASLLCHAGSQPEESVENKELLREWSVSGSFQHVTGSDDKEVQREVFQTISDEAIAVEDPVLRQVLIEIDKAWPSSVRYDDLATQTHRELAAAKASVSLNTLQEKLVVPLARLFRNRQVQVHSQRVRAVSRPTERCRSSEVCRFEASRGPVVTNVHHRAVRLDPIDCLLLSRLDGTSTSGDITKYLIQEVKRGQIELVGPDERVPSVKKMIRQIPSFVDSRLLELCTLGLIEE